MSFSCTECSGNVCMFNMDNAKENPLTVVCYDQKIIVCCKANKNA